MADTTEDVAQRLAAVANLLELEWEEYGSPGKDEYQVVIDSSIDYMQTLEGSVAMELPNVGVKVDRDDGGVYNIYLKVGSVEHDGES
jgi:hypothetical protein